jgi:hypothetical protein
MTYSQIISDLRKGCGKEFIFSKGDTDFDWVCGDEAEFQGKGVSLLCEICQAKLDQTLLCEKMINELIDNKLKKVKDMTCSDVLKQNMKWNLEELKAELESEVGK